MAERVLRAGEAAVVAGWSGGAHLRVVIYALTRRDTAFGLGDCLKSDMGGMSDCVGLLSCEQVFDNGLFPLGAYLFAGFDQLTRTELDLVTRARNALAEASPSIALLNDPVRWRPRLALLDAAFEAGINSFRATRATDPDRHRRFPVFIRSEMEHTGSLSPLLFDRASLVRALLLALLRGYQLRDLLIVEHLDVAVEGVVTKYSAMALGTHILPRSVARSDDWVAKYRGDQFDGALELRYVEENPHEAWIREAFALGGVEYGRVDYSLVNGRPQLWEINTNPTIGPYLALDNSSTHNAPLALGLGDDALYYRERGNRLFYTKFARVLETMAAEAREALVADRAPAGPVRISISPAERRRIAWERAERQRILARRTALGRLVAPIRAAVRAVRRGREILPPA